MVSVEGLPFLDAAIETLHKWAVRVNSERLGELWTAGEPDLLLVNAHSPYLLNRAIESS
ncbi:hypothetical protein [Mycolicibacterium setense]